MKDDMKFILTMRGVQAAQASVEIDLGIVWNRESMASMVFSGLLWNCSMSSRYSYPVYGFPPCTDPSTGYSMDSSIVDYTTRSNQIEVKFLHMIESDPAVQI